MNSLNTSVSCFKYPHQQLCKIKPDFKGITYKRHWNIIPTDVSFKLKFY